MNKLVRFAFLVFVLFRVKTKQSPVEEGPLISTIQFFKSENHRSPITTILKKVGVSETIYFEIVDNGDEIENVSNWPLNCWITLNVSQSVVDDSKRFLRDGCPTERGDASLYYLDVLRELRVRVSFKLKNIYEVLRKPIDVQCQFVKCSTLLNHKPWLKCPDIAHCTQKWLINLRKVELATSETHLLEVYKPPELYRIASTPLKNNKIHVEEKDDCFKCAILAAQKHSSKNDGRLSFPVVAAVSFASFAIGLLLMAGLCWIGTGHKGDVEDDQPKPQSHFVKYEPSTTSNESILNWSSGQNIATYSSKVALAGHQK